MKALLALVKAWASWLWSWVVWVEDKGWAGLKASFNYTYDPPAHHVKYWMAIVLAIAVSGMWFGGTLRGWFDRSELGQAMAPVRHVSSAPDTLLDSVAVFPSQMPAKLDAPKPADVTLPPLKVTIPVTNPAAAPANTGKVAQKAVTTYVTPRHVTRHVVKPTSSPFPG